MNLIELAEAGDVPGVLREMEALTLEQRASHAKELVAVQKAMGAMEMRSDSDKAFAVSSAAFGCQGTPKAAAVWLLNKDEAARGWEWTGPVVDLYPEEWRIGLVAELGERAKSGGTRDWFPLAEHIICDTGCPVPTTDAFVHAWAEDRAFIREERADERMVRPRMLGGTYGADHLERMRNDAFAPVLLPLVLARGGVHYLPDAKAVAGLAAEGGIARDDLLRGVSTYITGRNGWGCRLLEAAALIPSNREWVARERTTLIEPPLGRLLQDGTRMELLFPFRALKALAPTPADNMSFLRDFVAMLDLSMPVASYGQEALRGLDEAGLLEADVLTEACERVLLRPEKKLVRAQLAWLGRVAKRDPSRAGRAMVDASCAFQNVDSALQENALKLVARHLKAAGEDVVPEMREAAVLLSPAHAPRAAELFGTVEEAAPEPYEEILPEVPEPRIVPGPIGTAAEVAQEVAAVIANRWDVVPFERALDGLVRHARLDREALSAALKPVMGRVPGLLMDCDQRDIYDVAAAVRCDERRFSHISLREDIPYYNSDNWSLAGEVLRARLSEVIEVVESGGQPFLLAVPTMETGVLDASVLVERVAEFERLGIEPAPIDFAQALMRVTPEPGGEVLRAADALRSEAGGRLARWLHDGGVAHQDSTPPGWPVSDPASAPKGRWYAAHPGTAGELPLPPVAAALLGPDEVAQSAHELAAPFWSAQLPHHRDRVTARLCERNPGDVLTLIAEAGGPAGFAVHQVIANQIHLAWRPADGPVDALLILAARGQLDAELLGGLTQALVRGEWDNAKWMTASLRATAETGAYATVWSVIAAALPGLLRDTPVRGAGALLALATECVSRCGAKGRIPEVDEVAGRKGSSQAVKNARLLRDALRSMPA